MRRFSSEGCLLDLDFLPWRTVALGSDAGYDASSSGQGGESGTYTLRPGEDQRDCKTTRCSPPVIREPSMSVTLSRKHSTSVENLTELNKLENNLLRVGGMNEGCRAYSDGQLAPAAKDGADGGEGDDHDHLPSSPSYSGSSNRSHPGHTRAKLSAAKLHLKSLFGGLSPHSSHSNLFIPEQRDSGKERRSRLRFMRQWSQVGHSRGKFSSEELEKWAESLTSLLASQMGVAVFGAFLRSEFSEENLQFYLACEQYAHSSNNFSLQRRAREISTTYIQPGAAREVNLDSKTRDLTMQLLQAPSHTSLSQAQKRIYSLLDTDCYPRFLQSSIYLSLLREAD